MKKRIVKIVALCMALCLLLTGCGYIGRYFSMLGSLLFGGMYYSLDEMEYKRPDMNALQSMIDDSCTKAAEETKLNDLLNCIMDFNSAFNDFYTLLRSLQKTPHARAVLRVRLIQRFEQQRVTDLKDAAGERIIVDILDVEAVVCAAEVEKRPAVRARFLVYVCK